MVPTLHLRVLGSVFSPGSKDGPPSPLSSVQPRLFRLLLCLQFSLLHWIWPVNIPTCYYFSHALKKKKIYDTVPPSSYSIISFLFLEQHVKEVFVFSLYPSPPGLLPPSFHQKCVRQGLTGCKIQWPALHARVSWPVYSSWLMAHSTFPDILCYDLASQAPHAPGFLPPITGFCLCLLCRFLLVFLPSVHQRAPGLELSPLPFSACMDGLGDFFVLAPGFKHHPI